jgi:hypothetical protein
MAEEIVLIDVRYGPLRDKRLSVPADFAAKAIADGWARDALNPPPPEEESPLTEEQRDKVLAAAIEGAKVLRGEMEATPKEEEPESEERDMAAGAPGEYETRDMPAKRGPGRPPKT